MYQHRCARQLAKLSCPAHRPKSCLSVPLCFARTVVDKAVFFPPAARMRSNAAYALLRGLLQQVVVANDAHKVMRRHCRMSYTSVVSVNSWGQNVSCSLLLLLPFCPPGSGYKGWFALFDFHGVGCLEVHRVSSNAPDTTTLPMFSPWECVQLRVNVQKTFGTQ